MEADSTWAATSGAPDAGLLTASAIGFPQAVVHHATINTLVVETQHGRGEKELRAPGTFAMPVS